MKKIDKTTHLATSYFVWQATLHPGDIVDYNTQSIKNKYYKDVVMNLLLCQGGVCAYTEKFFTFSSVM